MEKVDMLIHQLDKLIYQLGDHKSTQEWVIRLITGPGWTRPREGVLYNNIIFSRVGRYFASNKI